MTYTVEPMSCTGEQRIDRINESDTDGCHGSVLVMAMTIGRLRLVVHGTKEVHRWKVVSVMVVVVTNIHSQIHRHGNRTRQGGVVGVVGAARRPVPLRGWPTIFTHRPIAN